MRAGRCRRPKRDAAANASAGRRGFKNLLVDSDDKNWALAAVTIIIINVIIITITITIT